MVYFIKCQKCLHEEELEIGNSELKEWDLPLSCERCGSNNTTAVNENNISIEKIKAKGIKRNEIR